MAIAKNNYQIYSSLADSMKENLSSFNPSFRPTDELSLVNYIQAKWNAVINNCSNWQKEAEFELKDTIFLNKFNYDLQAETLKIGYDMLAELHAYTFKHHTARKRQKKLIHELQLRLRIMEENH